MKNIRKILLIGLICFLAKSEAQKFNRGQQNGHNQKGSNPFIPQPAVNPPLTQKAGEIIQYCQDADGNDGFCMGIRSCQPIYSELTTRGSDPTFRQYLLGSICDSVRQTVCCPTNANIVTTVTQPITSQRNDEVPTRPPTLEEGCGYSTNSYKKVIGGQNAKKGAWPWLALIGYDEPNVFQCGGTLVTARHVLTAAHCAKSSLTFVRLGEHDLTTNDEAQHVDINVVRTVTNPVYNKRDYRGDLAVLFLERNAPLANHINPICLPSTPALRQKSYVNYTPFIAGWGEQMEFRNPATILQELQVPIHDNRICNIQYTKANYTKSANQFDSAVVCAGVLTGGQDSCRGDSGGPLMIPEQYQDGFRYYLLGVVSYGAGCARVGFPGVFASTQYFMDWILEQISTGP